MKQTRNEKGITLIALIITVIVLLIIAAVTIGAIQNGGIIDYAKKARGNYIENADSENTTLGNYLALIQNNIPSKRISEIAIGEKLEKTTKIEDEEGKIFWVPEGYAIVKDTTTNNQTLVNKGLVITDAVDSTGKSTGNEWVWIPAVVSEISEVVNGKNVGKLYDFDSTGATAKTYPTTQNSENREPDVVTASSLGADSASGEEYDAANLDIVLEGEYAKTKTAASFKAQLQDEFDNMIESVSKYGGYYIGRYEAGGTISSPVLKQGATVIRNISDTSNWYYMYKSAKALAANEKVTSGMIWGCQWDNTLRWLVSSGNKTWSEVGVDSRYWGNFSNSQGDAATYSGSGQSAGRSEYWKAGNIYDLASNYIDWTLETHSTRYRNGRGGFYMWRRRLQSSIQQLLQLSDQQQWPQHFSPNFNNRVGLCAVK